MKKIIIAAAVVALSSAWSTAAFAESRGAGCGLGYMVWKGQSGVMAHTSAGTTNHIVGWGPIDTQSVGMTVGTSGCSPEYTVKNEVSERAIYAETNFDHLKRDMARGDGEYLTGLAELTGVEDADRKAFYSLTRERFESLAGSAEVTATEFLSNLDRELAADATLSRYAM
ncbi:MAG: DUF3015 domain-containing protein [Nitrospirota bacterium]|nr:DUF3015 domain-containing protein [Nitrospirota bacterium]